MMEGEPRIAVNQTLPSCRGTRSRINSKQLSRSFGIEGWLLRSFDERTELRPDWQAQF